MAACAAGSGGKGRAAMELGQMEVTAPKGGSHRVHAVGWLDVRSAFVLEGKGEAWGGGMEEREGETAWPAPGGEPSPTREERFGPSQ